MHWTTYSSSRNLWCTQITEDELKDLKRKTEAFLLSCKNRYPKVSRDLEAALLALAARLVPGNNSSLVFRYADYKHLLRWSITDGRHLQDHRRDNGRALWRSLFRGPIPGFIKWNPMNRAYDEFPDDHRIWIQRQVTGAAAPADAA